MKFLRLLFLFLIVPLYSQQGGMWVPSLLKGMNEKEMKSLGMKMSAADIYDTNRSSLKDAIPHFNGGCTSEIISPKGLLLTNHHCGYGQIQSHSTVEKDYLTDGFWAMSEAEELPNAGLIATFIVKIEDVTAQVLDGVLTLSTVMEKQKKIQQNIALVSATYPKEAWQENIIHTFFEGNQYLLFVTETFKDIRLVGAPPSSIGKFGSDTDNWVWPRHTGDFSLFRIYADKNNRPAPYSKDNVPYTPKHFLPISLDGIKEDDFTLVFGYPGKTTEYLPAVALEQLIYELNPAKIEIRDATLKVANDFMRKDNTIKIQYASKYASIANYWKKWIGETQGIKKSNAIAIKKQAEADFQQKVIQTGKQAQYGALLSDFEKNYTEIAPYALSKEYFMEVILRNTELLSVAFKLYQLNQSYKTEGEQAFNLRKENLTASLKDFYKNFNKNLDKKVFEQLVQIYFTKAPKQFLPDTLFVNADYKKLTSEIYNQSKLTDYESLKELLKGEPKEVLKKIQHDSAFLFVKPLADIYFDKVYPKYEAIHLKIGTLQHTYMKAQLELNPNARIFPDANSTLRVTYGKVKGYNPADAVHYNPITYLEGVMEKYVPNDYEFDLPAKLIDLYNKKDYGIYGVNGKMPVNFIGTNHTTGGNSGSPALDAKGNLIGLNFDRVWEGTMSDLYYDPAICRNIMVDIRYVLFIIDKYANAKHLINEIKIVHPKHK